MGASTDWGTETHHSDYETYVNARTSSFSGEFDSFLSFDGSLTAVSAYDAAKNLAYDTTFDVDGDLTCVWMDQHYGWNNSAFKNRAGESLNLAINYLADVLHTLHLNAAQSGETSPTASTPAEAFPLWAVGLAVLATAAVAIAAIVIGKQEGQRQHTRSMTRYVVTRGSKGHE